MEGHVPFYSNQRVDGHFSDPEVGDGSIGHHDVHDDTLVLEFLRTNMVSDMVSAKERDRVLQRAKKYRLEGTHIHSPWLAMGYQFSRQASLASFSPCFLLYGRNPNLPTIIRRESSEVVNLDDPEMWLRVCSQRAELFQRAMPAPFENLAIVQHRDTLRYAIIQGGGC